MQPEQSIQPLNVAGATLLVQVLLLSFLGIGGRIFRARWSTSVHDRLDQLSLDSLPPLPMRTTPLTFLALSSFTLLLLSEDLYVVWSPLFQGLGISTIKTSTAIFLVYVLNLWAIGYLMFRTGGSASSPFLSALFTVPALAIFLRMPPWAFITIAILATLVYLALLAPGLDRKQPSQAPAAFMNVACLLLAMLTGYVTRPVAINELPPSKPTAQEGTVKAPIPRQAESEALLLRRLTPTASTPPPYWH
jgi:hypothetical protein